MLACTARLPRTRVSGFWRCVQRHVERKITAVAAFVGRQQANQTNVGVVRGGVVGHRRSVPSGLSALKTGVLFL